jgi:hypothetical protein
VVEFLQTAHEADERYSVRDGINIARYALKRLAESSKRLDKVPRQMKTAQYLKEAASMILDATASEYFKDIIDEVEPEE